MTVFYLKHTNLTDIELLLSMNLAHNNVLFSLSITLSYTLLLKKNLIGSPKGRVGRQRDFFVMEPRYARLIG